jgi:hypothetical protein
MKKLYKTLSAVMLLAFTGQTKSQCGVQNNIGSATNMFTLIRNGNHPIVVDKTMNMVVFVHRNNAGVFGGSSGELRFDVSTNAGATWTLNQGVLNPANSSFARYPNIAIYNPSLNTTPGNAYVSYMAPTINSVTSAWNGIVTGVRQVSGGIPTEFYNQNSIGTDQIPHSLVKGAPGVFWAIDPIGIIATGYNIYKGVWSNTLNDVVWSINYVATPPFTTGWTSAPQVVDYNIAFDPTGQIGYFSFLGHVNGGPSTNAVYPILYKTTNGGTNWTGPISVDIGALSCISSNTVNGYVPSANIEHDLIVDVSGNPHVITTVGNAASYIFNYSAWHHMYDLTLKNGMWVAYDLGNSNSAPYTAGVSPNFATQWQAPQAARSADGTKVFFTWTENGTYTLGQANSLPNLFSKAFNVSTGMWTQTKDFTSCNPSIAGLMTYPHMAAEVLEPNATSYKLAVVYGTPLVSNDLGQQADFRFLDNLTFANSEFTVSPPPATVTIAQAPTLIYCPGSTVNINVPNAGDILWSTGYTLNPMPVTTGSISTYSVIAQVGCNVGTATINVVNLNVTSAASAPTVCPGKPLTFTATGNALGYQWQPGSGTGTTVTMIPTSNVVTLTAFGSSSCTSISTISISVMPLPTITIAGSNTICSNATSMSLTAAGGITYNWNDGSSGNTYTNVAGPTPISVIGTGANSCTNTASIPLVVNPSPTVSVVGTSTAVCAGESATLMASGAPVYTWQPSGSGPNLQITPSVTSVYTVTGINNFSCVNSAVVGVTVNPLPTMTVTMNRPGVCKGEKITLTANGASSYTWTTLGQISTSVIVTMTAASTYTLPVILKSSAGCTNTASYELVVAACNGVFENGASLLFQVFPNPSRGNIVITANEDMKLQLSNQLGQDLGTIEVREENGYRTELNGLNPGIYFIGNANDRSASKYKIVVSQ